MTSPAQPAGWYADPSGLPATRWWDGQQWTDHLQPGPAVLPPTAGLGGYYPAAAPSGPLVPGAHTVAPPDPEAAAIFAHSAASAGAAFPAARPVAPGPAGGALPAPPAELVDYAIPPVDSAAPLSGFGMPAPAGDPEKRPAAQHATGLLTHPLLLGTLAVVVLVALIVLTVLR
ncbi:Protein piccolo [Actinoplanes sp. SE50]|uniref:DUF2510 domain-containing protein n=1 Tax=unclassified Actinoplanes TaxID=2626549 RepID=UPI00023ECE39|nr:MULTISPECIES: DUF2510 domain-containing protein [unclassified Actinoplanes]AEV83239.1 Protein piccolo [Actinoplanes sp. SE50/110]ATO81632.1 Protein piccolo [Actinoplanes sp. SE50]SLL99040.1 protein piccolo [Actinoplanes sp. SE50/110]